MRTWEIVAFADSEYGLPRKTATVQAESHQEAMSKAYKMFPEYHEIGAYAQY